MPKLRILMAIACASDGWRPGQIVDLADLPAGAEAWADTPLEDGSYRAEWVPEAAVTGPPETAMLPRAHGRRG